ncbi:nitronate monooxygenase, partial [Streptomyces eurythermus]|uniref:nitronate monooxygenase n=1 Tax=Streptomyces eurythermus TaxID=42237 RepID=UPI0033E696D6
SQHDQLERGLKSRHIQFLALGGAIGTGLFVGSGGILSSTGPAPLLMAYLSMMAIVWVIMNNLAEMVTYLPMRGITVPYLVNRFLREHGPYAPAAYPDVYHLTSPLRKAAAKAGDAQGMALWAGQGHRMARELPAGRLVEVLAAELAEARTALSDASCKDESRKGGEGA